jgi:hypothetical protein
MEYLTWSWPRNREFPTALRKKPETVGAIKVMNRLGYEPKKKEVKKLYELGPSVEFGLWCSADCIQDTGRSTVFNRKSVEFLYRFYADVLGVC